MKRKMYSKIRNRLYTILLIIIVFGISSPIANIVKAEEQLNIYAVDEVNENDEFTISVYVFDINDEIKFLDDVIITFNGDTYEISENAPNLEVIIIAPEVNEDSDMDIYAIKEGYSSGDKSIKIKNKPFLKVVPNSLIVNAGETFYVTIYEDDTNRKPVEGATVYVQNYGNNYSTNADGNAFLQAPKDFEKIKVIAELDGYKTGTTDIRINIEKPFWSQIVENKYFLIFVAIIILILAIVIVNIRQKKIIYSRAKEISDKNIVEKHSEDVESSYSTQHHSKEIVRISPKKDSRIEEIRISKPKKEKEVTPIETIEQETDKLDSKRKNKDGDYDWFKGTDEIRYEIDKLTGEIDEDGVDKWFEGVDTAKEKINDKMKKKKGKSDEENK